MKPKELASSTFLLTLFSAAAAAQSPRLQAIHFPSGTPGAAAFGSVLVGLGDVNGNGTVDYAVGAPTHTAGGATPAGQVEAFDGGAPLWSQSGSGSDLLGSALAPVFDLTQDGYPDVLVAAPGAAAPGDLVVLDGRTGTPFTMTSLITNGPITAMAAFPQDVDPNVPDGERDVALLGGGFVMLYSSGLTKQTGSLSAPLSQPILPQETVVSPAGDFFGTGAACVALGAPSLNRVRVLDLSSGQGMVFDTTALPPGVAGIGTSLAFDEGNQRVLCGAPGSFNNLGGIVAIAPNSVSLAAVGSASTLQMGRSVASGDLDGDGLWDFLAGGAGVVRVVLGDGSLQFVTGSPLGTPVLAFGASAAVVGDASGDGFDDFVVGNPAALSGAGLTEEFLGGPSATVNQNFGAGCTPTTFQPLIQMTPVRPGGAVTISIANGFLSAGFLAFGTPDPVGTPVPGSVSGCTSWVSGAALLGTLGTDLAGNASFVVPLPITTALLGLTFAVQEAVLYPGVAPIAASNAVSARVGW